MIFSSIVSEATKRVAFTGRVWPMRCARWIACDSEAGFHHGSMRKMWSAAWRLSPSPPAFKEISSTLREGSVWKEMMMLLRELRGIVPSILAQLMPSRLIRHSMSSRKRVNWEKTKALLQGSACCIFWSSCIRASILVEVLNSEVLMRCIMLPRIKLLWQATAAAASPATPSCTAAAAPPLEAAPPRDLRLGGGASSSPAASSSKVRVRGEKHVGQPMPPLGSFGACSKYSVMQSRWKAWPHCAATLVSGSSISS
mmetsp:Transcript_124579/g.398869  ORF Transcript_124579/g.398869 Transcript_124579/m.398869 type:complete len:255 (-) Transcript_124579:879-1643(-)